MDVKAVDGRTVDQESSYGMWSSGRTFANGKQVSTRVPVESICDQIAMESRDYKYRAFEPGDKITVTVDADGRWFKLTSPMVQHVGKLKGGVKWVLNVCANSAMQLKFLRYNQSKVLST